MEYMSFLAPIAFVFALSAIAQISALKKEVEKLREEISKNKN